MSTKAKHLAPIGLDLKTVADKPGLITGYGSVFGVTDSYKDIVARGAFTASLADWKAKGRRPAMLWQHDAAEPVGLWTDLVEDDIGLKCTGQLLLSVAKGAEAYEHLKAGTVSGLSIGFRTVERVWNDDTNIRTLTIVDLWEVSLVTFPANDVARIQGVKSAGAFKTIREFEAHLRDECGYSHAQAKQIASQGFKGVPEPRDEDGAVKGLLASIERARAVLKP